MSEELQAILKTIETVGNTGLYVYAIYIGQALLGKTMVLGLLLYVVTNVVKLVKQNMDFEQKSEKGYYSYELSKIKDNLEVIKEKLK